MDFWPNNLGLVYLPRENFGVFVNRILIAEDRESMRTALKAVFMMRPEWSVCGEAQDAQEAVTKAKELSPDLIVMDFKMHHSDGLTAASEIAKFMPSVPIVMFTLYKTDELEAAARQVGVRCVIGKEDGVHTLLRAMEAEMQTRDRQALNRPVNPPQP